MGFSTKGFIAFLIVCAGFMAVANCEYQEQKYIRDNVERHDPSNRLYNYEYRDNK